MIKTKFKNKINKNFPTFVKIFQNKVSIQITRGILMAFLICLFFLLAFKIFLAKIHYDEFIACKTNGGIIMDSLFGDLVNGCKYMFAPGTFFGISLVVLLCVVIIYLIYILRQRYKVLQSLESDKTHISNS